MHSFTDKISGRTCMTPWTVEDAIANGRATYMDRDGCTECGTDRSKARYVETGECVGCFMKHEMGVFNLWTQGMPGRPEPFCTSRDQAEKAGQNWYFGGLIICPHGPHFQRKDVTTGRCIDCEASRQRFRLLARGPRAIARASGRTTYLPTEACTECGEVSARNVVTNACLGLCAAGRRPRGRPPKQPDTQREVAPPKPDGRRTPTSMMVEQFPDMIISREAARISGFTQYRTGDPCRRGHTGWRYVSVGTCIPCARGEP